MRKIRYRVAMSLDGYIAGPNGEYDWIVSDPEVNFAEIWAQFDTMLMGRRTYELALPKLGEAAFAHVKTIVASRTLRPVDHPKVTVVSELARDFLQAMRAKDGKDIWLMGGGLLFRAVLEMGEVDTVEVSVMPVMLGGGIPFQPPLASRSKLKLTTHKVYRSGIVSLTYDLQK